MEFTGHRGYDLNATFSIDSSEIKGFATGVKATGGDSSVISNSNPMNNSGFNLEN